MNYKTTKGNEDFEKVLLLITEARNRVYSKANKELVLLYFNVGKVVSQKVNEGNWGENTVQQLADFIHSKVPNLSGFNRRGLYRMKQFFEVYMDSGFLTALAAILKSKENEEESKVSTLWSQLQIDENLASKFVSTVLTSD